MGRKHAKRRIVFAVAAAAALGTVGIVLVDALGGPRPAEVVAAARGCEIAGLRDLLARGGSASTPSWRIEGISVGEPRRVVTYPVTAAAEVGCVDALRTLNAAGAALDVEDSEGMSPLSLAAREGRRDAVAWLLSEGVNPNGRDDSGRSALHWAAGYGDAATVEALLRAGARKGLQDRHRLTPLALAEKRQGPEAAAIVALLRGP